MEWILALLSGEASVVEYQAGETRLAAMAPGDLYLMRRSAGLEVKGRGRAVLVSFFLPGYRWGEAIPPRQVVRARTRTELRWAGGKMRARPMLDATLSPEAYAGWIDGELPVPRHAHPGSCEVVVLADGSGTAMRNTKPARIAPGAVQFMAPGEEHAFQPDPGTSFRALQLYLPRGPEERFSQLARERP
jgi:hypothetical protein